MADDERIYKQLDRIEARLDSTDATLIRNTISLEEHIKRTDLLEQDLKPIKAHVQLMNTLAKIVSVGAGAAALAKTLGVF